MNPFKNTPPEELADLNEPEIELNEAGTESGGTPIQTSSDQNTKTKKVYRPLYAQGTNLVKKIDQKQNNNFHIYTKPTKI